MPWWSRGFYPGLQRAALVLAWNDVGDDDACMDGYLSVSLPKCGGVAWFLGVGCLCFA